ncbi:MULTISPECIES: NYN domain-containing protein [unclassified Nocardioides]|uniref:NYN domain-containing protein n=1 Tax=unclassified Nocardioides TaxID=2615069 RepID=UPI000056F8F6|nr:MULTISPECIES: NYN domain-containing protein [unclassified Nocardioides]ABL80545.1 hypothetical protein Noca_1026 [Nocardioides sp. JS614]
MSRNRKFPTQIPRYQSTFSGRAIHLIDAENLLGGPNAAPEAFIEMWRVYRGGIVSTTSDQFVLAGSSFFFRNVLPALAGLGAQLLVRDGEDGAELALLDGLNLTHAADRFDRVVIASGDGMFEDLAIEARRRGLHVHQVTGLGRCSAALSRAATTHAQLHLNFMDAEPHAGLRTLAKLRAAGREALIRGIGLDPTPERHLMFVRDGR